jgi:hypothetical protein
LLEKREWIHFIGRMPNKENSPGNSMSFECPLPLGSPREIQMGHGGGGRLSRQLIDGLFLPAFSNAALSAANDLAMCGARPRWMSAGSILEECPHQHRRDWGNPGRVATMWPVIMGIQTGS